VRRSREQWAALVSAFEKAGVSVERFCVSRGIAAPSLRWWRWHLQRSPVERGRRRDATRLLAVEVCEEGAASRSASRVAIVVHQVEVCVDVGTDVDYVAALVARLRRA
jgi:hypothetical protein